MNFFSYINNRIIKSKRFAIIYSIIVSVITFFLGALFIPDLRDIPDLIISILTGLVAHLYIRKFLTEKKEKDHQQLK
ncbi:MAG: hypothetical protein B6D37_07770 [Sphingobacteriales bacterium UTBCD1]|jgi:uncharacterized membrane protein YadS|nr:MAG: hypothetical protein B6D37_07770 [Sphingobacteriales bacterium UTBCD1]